MKKSLLIQILAILTFTTGLSTQIACQPTGAFIFEGKIKGLEPSKIVFNRVLGHKEQKMAEVQSGIDGSIRFSLDEYPPEGQYRLRIDPAKRNAILEFLVTGGNIRFSTVNDFLPDSMRFENSKINEAWYAYFRIKEDYEGRLSILDHLLGIYPEDKRFYPEILKEFGLLQDERDSEVEKLIAQFPNTLLSRYIASDRSPRIDPKLAADEKQEFVRRNFLKNIDFTDTMLLRTDLLPGKVLSYIMLYRNQRYSREQQAQEFIRATDNLLPLAMVEPLVYNYLLEYTISGFEQIGLEQVLTHIADHYTVDETCISNQSSSELQRRMEGYRKLASGNLAPEIQAQDINSKAFQLSKSDAEHTLMIFWASWCPHCKTMLPEIKKIVSQLNSGNPKTPKLRIVSVSIDHSEKDYMDFLTQNALNDSQMSDYWVNICDYKAWEGKIANDYYLYATPTMVLTGKNRIITGKPGNIQELMGMLGFRL